MLVYTLTRQKLYQSVATVQIFRRDPIVMQVQGVMDNEVRSAEDLNTQVSLLESASIVKMLRRVSPGRILSACWPLSPSRTVGHRARRGSLLPRRKILPERAQPDRQCPISAPRSRHYGQVANLIADAYIDYNEKIRTDESLKAVEDLRDRAEEQRKKVDQLAVDLQAYRERNNLVSLDQRKDINTEKLKALNAYLTDTSNRLSDAEVRWEQVHSRRAKKEPLTDLPFIASQPLSAAHRAGRRAADHDRPAPRALPGQAPEDDRGREVPRTDPARAGAGDQ